MTVHLGTNSPLDDQTLAAMAVAGVRELRQGTAAPATAAAATYTVVDVNCRRVMCFHLGATTPSASDIRVRADGTEAAATNMPLVPQRYAVFELTVGETVSFFNTSAETITVYCLELM